MPKEIKAVQRGIEIHADEDGNLPDAIHLLDVGHWHTPYHGAFEHTKDDLAAMVTNFNAGVGLVVNKRTGNKEAPVNYGHDRGGKASGWMYELYLDESGTQLWAKVRWTKAGAQALREEEYKFISPEWNPRDWPWENPEVEGEFVDNVFTGAALTNIPLLRELTPIMASAGKGDSDNKPKPTEGGDMDLAQVRLKKLDELSAEEKTFLAEHQAELTDAERSTFELKVEESAEDKAARELKEKEDAEAQAKADREAADAEAAKEKAGLEASALHGYTPEKLRQLEADAAAGRAASDQLLRTTMVASVDAAVTRGAIKSGEADKTVELLTASSEGMRSKLLSFITNLPDNKLASAELGDGGTVNASAQGELNKLAADVVAKSGGATSYADAVNGIMGSNTDLAARVRTERQQ